MEKGFKNHKEALYSSKGKSVYAFGKLCNKYLQIAGKSYSYHRVFPVICKY
jgi:hypothetical protein